MGNSTTPPHLYGSYTHELNENISLKNNNDTRYVFVLLLNNKIIRELLIILFNLPLIEILFTKTLFVRITENWCLVTTDFAKGFCSLLKKVYIVPKQCFETNYVYHAYKAFLLKRSA